ncbi:acyloxyacyl hydrolase [Roseobacter denitrificans]|uniref:Lipid A 3-O-deacylase n=1 Tax=Roseobacter denitrificans (strain ATCC 33942 / OCh 114) TaxID=375451 RepID=Q167B0_ROSDO|nr:acyloxyacyl hydrolase [Roseobacter denitrificans]ABG31933.1 conserved hypothetical protein [Roseobacter denitrificans OCh 114]AVL51472.1 acyloxyacyl hydrolase [Roseobacter denitrificans]SFG34795.1 Lipid A 3-O-deacylase (PagL) [Roseobacter denitrificans OCh 114]
MKFLYISALAIAASTAPACASEIVLGLGTSDVGDSSSGSPAFQFEYHSNPVRSYQWGSVAGLALLQLEDDSTIYAGLGLSGIWNLSPNWFAEGSLAAGYYDAGSGGTDLGGNLQFRTLIGLGYRLSSGARISFAVDHLSNAGIESHNPGRETVSVRYGFSF